MKKIICSLFCLFLCLFLVSCEVPGPTPGPTPGQDPDPETSIKDDYDCISIAEAIELAKEAGSNGTSEKYYVYGIISNIKSNVYGEMTITDETGSLYVYGVYSKDGETRYDAMEEKPVEGDEVVLYGMLKTYNDQPEMDRGYLQAFNHIEQEIDDSDYQELTIDQARTAEKGKLVKSALHFSNATVDQILTPWDQVLKIQSSMKTHEILDLIKQTGHSRIPVVDRQGNVKGILQIRRFIKAFLKSGHNVVLSSVLDYPYFVKNDIVIDDLLSDLSNHKRNLAIIKGNDGKIVGIVTIEDILEELVGEIYDEDDIGGEPDA